MDVDEFLSRAGDLHMAGTSTRENGLKETVTLKWCTPRSNNIGGLEGLWVRGRNTQQRRERNVSVPLFQSCITAPERIASPPQTSTVARRRA